MATSPTQRVILRFEYRYLHTTPAGTFLEDHIKLKNICHERLRELNHLQHNPIYPWDCESERLESGHDLVELSVHFIHNVYDNDSTLASPHAKLLWHALVDLFYQDSSHTLFGGPMFSINVYPVNLNEGVATIPFTFCQQVLGLALRSDIPVQMADVPERSLGSKALLAVDVLLCFLSYSEHASAIYTASSLPSESVSVASSMLIEGLSKLLLPSESTSDVCSTSIEVPSSMPSARKIAETARGCREILQSTLDEGPKEEALLRLAECAKNVKRAFIGECHAAVARLRFLHEKESPSTEDCKEALESVCNLTSLSSQLKNCLKSLNSNLKDQRTVKKVKVTAVSVIAAAVSTTAAVLGPPGWAAWLIGHAAIGVTAASASHLMVKQIEEGPQIESLRQDIQRTEVVLLRLLALTVTVYGTKVFRMDQKSMRPKEKEDLLRQFGVDPNFIAEKDYANAQLKATLDELEQEIWKLLDGVNGIFLDLGIEIDTGLWKLT